MLHNIRLQVKQLIGFESQTYCAVFFLDHVFFQWFCLDRFITIEVRVWRFVLKYVSSNSFFLLHAQYSDGLLNTVCFIRVLEKDTKKKYTAVPV